MSSTTLGELLQVAAQHLRPVSATPRLDAEVLLAAALERPRSYLLAWPQRLPTWEQHHRFMAWLERRLLSEPVAYILGRQEFWSLELDVTPATLIPRPDTELVVELALTRLPLDRAVTVADMGTGSGAIALALASERPQARLIATDQSLEALGVARRNAHRLGISNVEFRAGDWYNPLAGERCELIASNPPYIATGEPCWQQGALRFEPVDALVSGEAGLDALSHLIMAAPAYLVANGWLVLEHGYDQGEAVLALLRERGFVDITDHRDNAGLSRCSCARWNA